ncbi:hypothetical protein QF037_006758 [Streptomyces canus]|uniref:hypothetical protein n=1 Tax=Streptomyces canus TaxID=58343 RepID=UPI0027884CFA|nr:hypothetical protein [Streptomyces canus]MDQ0602413.1 hypothetical protein [Streptomyces canus]
MSGSVWLPPGARPDTTPGIPRQRTPSWAQPDPLDELAVRLDDFVAAAVHPDEIAALLESDGMSDDQIRERYGLKNSFALAEELYERVERRYPEPEGPVHDPWQVGLLGCLLRGVVFALPGLGYVLGAPLMTGPRDLGLPAGTIPLLAGALAGWTWNQGLAHRAYSWLGLGDRTAAKRSLLLGAPAGVVLGALVAFLVAGTGDMTGVAFAAGQALYLGASTVLLVLGRERALLLALLPMAAGTALGLVRTPSTALRLVLLLGSLLAVVVLGLLELRDKPQRTHGRQSTMRPQLVASLPYALFGLGTGVLVLYAALDSALAAVALTLSMGPAEWLLHRFRSGSLAGLRNTSTPRAFWRTTATTLVECLTIYLVTLLVLGLAMSALSPGLLVLGVVLWTGLLLQSFGAILSATAVCCAAALTQTLALLTHTGTPHWVALIVHGTAAAAQAALVCALLGRATAHR